MLNYTNFSVTSVQHYNNICWLLGTPIKFIFSCHVRKINIPDHAEDFSIHIHSIFGLLF